MHFRTLYRRLTAGVLLSPVLAAGIALGIAHGESAPITINLNVGEIFEIIPVHTVATPTYAWIFTQDRTFLQASRTKSFRVRTTDPGTFTLVGEITSSDQSTRTAQTFTVIVHPRDGSVPQLPPGATTETPLVQTTPALIGGKVLTDANVLAITPVNLDQKPLLLDTDLAFDSDGNGNSSDDVDSADTFFQTDATPLFLWLADGKSTRDLRVRSVASDGNPITQNITVMDTKFAVEENVVLPAASIVAQPSGDATFAFSVTFNPARPPEDRLLLRWSFGDGEQSMVPTPEHTYARAGTYTVTVTAQSILDGSKIAEATFPLQVSLGQTESAASAQSVSSAVATSTASDQTESTAPPEGSSASTIAGSEGSAISTPTAVITESGSGFLTTVVSAIKSGGKFLPYVLLILGILVIAGLIAWLLSKLLRHGNLEQTFAAMEKKIVEGKMAPSSSSPPPLTITSRGTPTPSPTTGGAPKAPEAIFTIKASTPSQPPPPSPGLPPPKVAEREAENKTPPLKQNEAKIDTANAPAWLKQGLTGSPAPAAPKPPQSPPAPPVAPKPPSIPTPPVASPPTAKPPATPPTPPPPSPNPVPAPTPAPTAIPPKPISPTPPSTPAPGSSVPSWLQQPGAPPTTSQTPPPVAPAPVKPVTPPSPPPPQSVTPPPSQKPATPAGPSAPPPPSIPPIQKPSTAPPAPPSPPSPSSPPNPPKAPVAPPSPVPPPPVPPKPVTPPSVPIVDAPKVPSAPPSLPPTPSIPPAPPPVPAPLSPKPVPLPEATHSTPVPSAPPSVPKPTTFPEPPKPVMPSPVPSTPPPPAIPPLQRPPVLSAPPPPPSTPAKPPMQFGFKIPEKPLGTNSPKVPDAPEHNAANDGTPVATIKVEGLPPKG